MPVPRLLAEFDGLPVVEFGQGPVAAPPGQAAWLVHTDGDAERLQRFLRAAGTTAVTHLVIGCWDPGYPASCAAVQVLTEAASRLPGLKAVLL
jgi:hypothetical protein